MSIENAIMQAGLELANDIQRRIAGLEKKKAELENELSINQAALDAAKFCHDHFADFQVKFGPNYQCPRCWINNESRSALRPIPSDTDTDILRCSNCQFEVLIEL
jgi:DNA-directed RNA polymerase subunit RPC12/RpoP